MASSIRGAFVRRCLLCLAIMALAACGKSPDLIVYVSADEQVARPIIESFERESGLTVGVRYDTEATKTVAKLTPTDVCFSSTWNDGANKPTPETVAIRAPNSPSLTRR